MTRFMQASGRVLLALFVALASGVVRAADLPASKAITVKAPRAADTFVRSGSSSRRNYGAEKTLELRSANRDRVSESYLQFNIIGMSPKSKYI